MSAVDDEAHSAQGQPDAATTVGAGQPPNGPAGIVLLGPATLPEQHSSAQRPREMVASMWSTTLRALPPDDPVGKDEARWA